MKSWLTRFKISNSLDAGKPGPASLNRAVSNSADLRRFQQKTTELDRALKHTAPVTEVPPFLHASIINAIRSNDSPRSAVTKFAFARWAAAAACAALILPALWMLRPQPPVVPAVAKVEAPSPKAPMASVFEIQDDIARSAPVAVMRPLSNELAGLNLDLKNTAKFLLANVP